MESSSTEQPGHQLSSCTIPAFGDAARIAFQPRASTCDVHGNPTEYVLSAFDFEQPRNDFGMLCLELYRHRVQLRTVVHTEGLESNVLSYMNSRPPDPGMDAELTSSAAIGSHRFGTLLEEMVDGKKLRQ